MKNITLKTCIGFISIALTSCSTTPVAKGPNLGPAANSMIKDVARLPLSATVTTHLKKGLKELRRKKYKKATEQFSAGLRLEPTNGNLHFLNALAYHLMSLSGDQSKLDLAEAGYALALRYTPDNYWAAYYLGHVYFSQKRFVDAQNQFSYALMFEPGKPSFLRAVSVSSYYAKNLNIGHWAAEKAVEVDPENPLSWRVAMFARAATGDQKGAKESLNKYKNLEFQKSSFNNWSKNNLSNRIQDWGKFHKKIQLAQGNVFATDAKPEGEPLNLGDQGDDYDGTDDDSSTSSSTSSKSRSKSKSKSNVNLPKMTLVDVVILRLEEDRNQSKGVNLLAGIKATLTGTLYAFNRVTGFSTGGSPARARTQTISPTLALAGLQYNLNIFNDGVNKAEVLARPSLLAAENQPSKFYSGAILHVQLNSNNSDGSLVDVPVGIHLDVTPTFLDDETVSIKVHAERNFIETRDDKLGFTAFSQTAKTSVDATAALKFGQMMILSGLSENEQNKTKDGVPFLRSIPGIQYFFSRKTEEETKKSVLILLAPHKARYADQHMSHKELKRTLKERYKDTKHTKALKKKLGLGLKDNLDVIFAQLDSAHYFRQFQTGDLGLDEWHDQDSIFNSLKRALGFLWY